jgi:hypothetical protein
MACTTYLLRADGREAVDGCCFRIVKQERLRGDGALAVLLNGATDFRSDPGCCTACGSGRLRPREPSSLPDVVRGTSGGGSRIRPR